MIVSQNLFGDEVVAKSYRAIRHDVVRGKQKRSDASINHPVEKSSQIKRVLNDFEYEEIRKPKILELFAGDGFLTNVYAEYGDVTAFDKKLGTGDSFKEYHRLIADNKKFDVVDLDPYGFPTRFFPDIFLLIDRGILFVTCPIPSVNILHDITKTHLFSYFGNDNPTIDQITKSIALSGLCHWRKVTEIESIKMDRMWRIAYLVEKIKATEYTGVRNR
ncbi:MAG: N2,N2-dimethylguanosine tRNA methyltransferase [Bacteroidota bacterium]